MKLFGKMTLMSLAMVVTASFGFLSPMLVGGATYGASGESSPVIRLTDYTPSYNIGDTTKFSTNGSDTLYGYALPKAEATKGTVEVTAKNSARLTARVELGQDGCYYLVTTKPDKYEIIYTAENSSTSQKTTTRNVTVEIKTNGATLVMPENVPQIIPTVVYRGDTIVFPKATIEVDGQEVAAESERITITLEDALGNKKTLESEGGLQKYTITETDSGDFIVTYSYTENGNNLSNRQTFRVMTNTQDVELKYSDTLTSKLESMALEVGVEVSLPKPTVVNAKASDADVSDKVYTVVTVREPDGNTVEVTDFKYTPKQVGNYRFSYKTVDFAGNAVETSVARDNIKLSSNSIEVKVVDAYDTDATASADFDFDAQQSAEYAIDSVLYIVDGQTSVVGEFPAILAQGGWNGFDNLQLTRSIWKNGNRLGTLEAEHTVSGVAETYLPNQIGKYEFSDEGTYEIYYQARYLDDDGKEISNTQKSIYFTFEVEKVSALPTEEDANLTLRVPSISTTAVLKNEGTTLTFNGPSVSDNYDTRLNVEVTYKFNGIDTVFDATKNEDGTYSIEVVKPNDVDVSAWNNVNTMTINFKATDFLGYSTQSEILVSVLDFSSDDAAPTLSNNVVEATYDNGSKLINLPTVSFSDTATNISLVMYVMKDGKQVDSFNGNQSAERTATIDARTYEPTQEGKYTFVYVATDQNRNMAVFSLDCEVDFELGYSVAIESIANKEYGTVINIPSLITVTKNGQIINFANSSIKVLSEVTEDDVAAMTNNSLLIQVYGACTLDGSGINGNIICGEGDIYIKAWAKDDKGVCDFTNNASSLVKFNSTDSTNPEFTIENEISGSDVIASYEFADNSEGNTHTLPWFNSISDLGGINEDSMKVELTYANSNTPFKTFTLADADANNLEYTVTQEGKIKVVYSVADNVKGNTATRTFWIHVGDVLAPEIIVANDAITSPSKVGESFSIALDKITFANDTDLSKVDDLKIQVKVNGNTVDTELDDQKKNVIFTAAEAGTYVITFDITDEAGNVATTITKNIVIKSDSPNTVNSSTVWGTVMIVIALLVVAVVIFFFVKPTKSKSAKSKTVEKKTK